MTRKSAADIERDIEATRAQIGQTLDALKERLSPGQMLDSFLGVSRIGPALMQQGVARTFRDYPVPAALVGAGLWMMLTGRTGMKPAAAQTDESVDRSSQAGKNTQPGAVAAFAGEVVDKLKAAVESTSTSASHIRDEVTEKAGGLRDQVGELTDQARSKVHDTMDTARGHVDQARAQVRGYKDNVVGRIPEVRQNLRSGVDSAQAFITEYPLVAGALLAAVGGVCASLFPVTERERTLLAGQGRKLRDAAQGAMDQGKVALGNIADAAVSKTREEIGGIADHAKQGSNGAPAVH